MSLTEPFHRLRRACQDQPSPDLAQRKRQLTALEACVKAHSEKLVSAVNEDFGHRSVHETQLSDISTVLSEIRFCRPRLRQWMQPRPQPVGWKYWPGRAHMRVQPLGVVGIISPWNYPINLALVPLVDAIAAGNRVMLKPSEVTPRTGEALRELLADVFEGNQVQVVLGGVDVAKEFTSLPFDHLFFTGSTAVGKKVMAAAAKNLTPVTLELGGKSPAIIAPDYPLEDAAHAIARGKLLNAGQTCIAPDYVLMDEGRVEALVDCLRHKAQSFYPAGVQSDDYSHIVNPDQLQRLRGLLQDAEAQGAQVHWLLEDDSRARALAPTVVTNLPADSQLMQEEIFGPILPIVPTHSMDTACAHIQAGDRPLAMYCFDHNRSRRNRVLRQVTCGGVTVNDTLFHLLQEELPFGGVGASGMGSYHGQFGFDTFSKFTGVFEQARITPLKLLAPPYSGVVGKMVGWLAK